MFNKWRVPMNHNRLRRPKALESCYKSLYRTVHNRVDRLYNNSTSLTNCFFYLVDLSIYFMGPFLVVFAMLIIFALCHTFYFIVVPMMKHHMAHAMETTRSRQRILLFPIVVHESFVVLLVLNIVINYFACVTCRKDRPGSKNGYEFVVRELASVTGFQYPETLDEREAWRLEWRRKRIEALATSDHSTKKLSSPNQNYNQLQSTTDSVYTTSDSPLTLVNHKIPSEAIFDGTVASFLQNSHSRPQSKPSWIDMNPYDWSYCYYSNLPKPPRAHFDNVSQNLILNMDHYCPWMFNAIGFYNYRYFFNFLLYVAVGLIYGAIMTYKSFISIHGHLYHVQANTLQALQSTSIDDSMSMTRVYPYVPLPSERTAVGFSFMLCASVGVAVICLLGFHTYLILSAQTTIEFYGNLRKRAEFKNPYSLGWKRNLQQIFGSGFFLFWFFPSIRDPDFLPIPLPGDAGKMKGSRTRDDLRGVKIKRGKDSGCDECHIDV